MDASRVDMFLMTMGDRFPPEKIMFIRERLLAADDSRFAVIQSFEYKNPNTMLIVSIFLGGLGIDRFMNDDIGLGILKLITFGGCGVWTIIDWFLIMGETREKNFLKLMSVLV